MYEPDEHERVIELLRRARRPDEEITPERLEENLRWLIRLARPEEKASLDLRERVRAIAEKHQRRRPSLRERLFAMVLPLGRRALAGAFTVAAACVALLALFATRAPAQVLARTLDAMARVRSAHCTGWRITYRKLGKEHRSAPASMAIEWWYKAPDWYRKEMRPAHAARTVRPFLLVVNGNQVALTSDPQAVQQRRITLSQQALTQYLSPLDFFSQQGFLWRAQTQKTGSVREYPARYHDHPVQAVAVEVRERRAGVNYRNRWLLYVDPASDRILHSDELLDRQAPNGAWQTEEEEILDDFEYDIPLKDRLFEVKSPALQRRAGLP